MKKTSKNAGGTTENMTLTLGGEATQSRDEKVREPKRPPRIRMGVGMNLYVPEDLLDRERFAYRFFAENDTKRGRIAAAIGAYWEHVELEGTNITRPSGNDTLYLMRLPIEYYNEDQKLKQQRVQDTLDSETRIGANEYAPSISNAEGGTSATTRTTSNGPV